MTSIVKKREGERRKRAGARQEPKSATNVPALCPIEKNLGANGLICTRSRKIPEDVRIVGEPPG